jgi:hypothetical protein
MAGVGAAGKGCLVTPASRTAVCSAAAAGVGKGGRQANGVTGSRLSSPCADPDAPAVRKAGTAGVGTSITRGGGTAGEGDGKDEASGARAGEGAGAGGAGAADSGTRDAAVRVAAPSPVAVVGDTAGAPIGGCVGGVTPQARPASETRATGAGGGLTSVSDTSGSNDGGADGSKCADASNTSLHWPQRTHPSDMRNWSATTLKEVAQDGQRVIWLISGGL